MKVKHFYFLFLCISIFVFTACGGDKDERETGTDPVPEPPATEDVVLSKATVILTTEQLDNVTSVVTGNTIYVSSSTDKAKLPKLGQVLLVSKPSEKFPYGFMGRVKRITQETGSYKIETESVALNEVFDKLFVNQQLELVPASDQTRAAEFEYTDYVDADGFRVFECSLAGKKDGSELSGNVSVGIKVTCLLDINNKAGKDMASIVMTTRFTAGIGLDIDQKVSSEISKKLLSIPFKVTPINPAGVAAAIVLRPSFDLDFKFTADGEFKLNANGEYTKEIVAGVEYKDGVWKAGSHAQKEEGNNNFTFGVQAKVDGKLEERLSAGFHIRVATDDIAQANISVSAGLVQEAHFSYDSSGQAFYDKFKDTYLSSYAELGAAINGSIPIIKESPEVNLELVPTKRLFEKEYYLFPSFDKMNIKTDKEKMTASISSVVHRDLLFSGTQIGLSLMDEDMKTLQNSAGIAYQKENEIANPWENAFKGLEANKKYKVRPFVKFSFMDHMFGASPVGDFKIDKAEVFTLEATAANENSMVCNGQFKLGKENIPSSYGICYSETNKNPSVSDKKVTGSNMNAEGYFSTLLEKLDREKTYYYRAFIVQADATVVYGEVRSFNFSPVGTWKCFKCVVMEKKCTDFPSIYEGLQWDSDEGGTITFNADKTGHWLLDGKKTTFTWRFNMEERAIYAIMQGQQEIKATVKYSDSEFCMPVNDWACDDHITDIYWRHYKRIE